MLMSPDEDQEEDFNKMDIEQDGQVLSNNRRIFLDEKRWNVIINSHVKLKIHESILFPALEDFFAEELEDVIRTIMLDNDASEPILPIVNFYYETYVKGFLKFVSKFDSKNLNEVCNSVIKTLDVDISHIFVRIHIPKVFDF